MRRFLTRMALLTLLVAGPSFHTGATGAGPVQAQSNQPGVSNPDPAAGAEGLSRRDAEAEAEAKKVRTRRFQYLMLGYGLIWVSLGYYLFDLNRRVSRVGNDIGELKGRLDISRNRKGR